jgi:hypothetical protein
VYIREYRIAGVKKLTPAEAGDAVYPFLGPERTAADVEQARTALERSRTPSGGCVCEVRTTSIWNESSGPCRP